mmetsp:Transcript_8492/g.20953  ORF Transcript_8492/g.20953 Transcript_8492/m.20953 type:complete len:243 (+) Transcript_8492:300-1028(+)
MKQHLANHSVQQSELVQKNCGLISARNGRFPSMANIPNKPMDDKIANMSRTFFASSIAPSIAISTANFASFAFCAAVCFAELATFEGIALMPSVVFSNWRLAASWMLFTMDDANAFTGRPRALRTTSPSKSSRMPPVNPTTPPRVAPKMIGTASSNRNSGSKKLSRAGSKSERSKAATEPSTKPRTIPPIAEDIISTAATDRFSCSSLGGRASRVASSKFIKSSFPIFFLLSPLVCSIASLK